MRGDESRLGREKERKRNDVKEKKEWVGQWFSVSQLSLEERERKEGWG